MKVMPLCLNSCKNRRLSPNFRSETVYENHKIIEKDILSLSGEKYLTTNPLTPNQEILGVNLSRKDNKTIEIKSRYGNRTGEIVYNPNVKQPQINVQAGSFQPIIELKDEELGITLLMTRGSSISGSDLNINYKELAKPSVSFKGNNLVVVTGYKKEKIENIVNNYKFNADLSDTYKLKQDYTIIGLAGGYGSRLKPISDLEGDNKPSTKLPGGSKTLLESAVLDLASKAGKIDSVKFIENDPNDLSGTAGSIIKGLKDATVPPSKPLVLLTGDTFGNIDLAEVAYQFENKHLSGIAMIVYPVDENDLIGKAPIKFDENNEISELYPVITPANYSEIVSKARVNGKIYAGSNITIIQPEILAVLKKFADSEGKADFLEFLGLMFNVLNKNTEILTSKYPNGLKSEELAISDLVDYTGRPKYIYDSNNKILKLKAIIANENSGANNKTFCSDMGTIEEYFNTLHKIKKEDKIEGIKQPVLDLIKSNIDNNGVIYMNSEAKSKLEQFKQKYGISSIRGNVIAHSFKHKQPEVVVQPPREKIQTSNGGSSRYSIFNLTYNSNDNDKTVFWIVETPDPIRNPSGEMIKRHGLMPFIKWYLSPDGYYGAYERFVKKLYNNVKNMEVLIKFTPNWAPWKLEEKFWMLQNPSLKKLPEETRKILFNQELETKREIPFTIGELPSIFPNADVFLELVKTLKSQEILDQYLYIGGNSYKAKRLKGGELNDKFIYLIERNGEKFILKFDRINVEDSDTVNGRKLSLLEKRSIRKNKYLAADSIYSNACISKYLIYQGCKIVPDMFYYHHGANAAVYEYIEDKDGDLFQKDVIDTEYDNLLEANQMHQELNKLGIFVNDTACKNTLTDKNGVKKIIDLGHASFFIPFKLNLKHYNVEFSNANGPDIGAIYASLLTTLTANEQKNVNNCK